MEATDDNGQTALTMAVRRVRFETVRLLLDLNADMTKSDLRGWNVSQTRNAEMRQLLLEHSKKSVSHFFCVEEIVYY